MIWKLKNDKMKYSNSKLWEMVNTEIKKRQKKVEKQAMSGKLRRRQLQGEGWSGDKYFRTKNVSVYIARATRKANKILLNVCKGVFVGNYAE